MRIDFSAGADDLSDLFLGKHRRTRTPRKTIGATERRDEMTIRTRTYRAPQRATVLGSEISGPNRADLEEVTNQKIAEEIRQPAGEAKVLPQPGSIVMIFFFSVGD